MATSAPTARSSKTSRTPERRDGTAPVERQFGLFVARCPAPGDLFKRRADAISSGILQVGVSDDRIGAGTPRPERREAPDGLAVLQPCASRHAPAPPIANRDQGFRRRTDRVTEPHDHRFPTPCPRALDAPGARLWRSRVEGLDAPGPRDGMRKRRVSDDQRDRLSRMERPPESLVGADTRLDPPGMHQQRHAPTIRAGQAEVEERVWNLTALRVEQLDVVDLQRHPKRHIETQLDSQEVLRHCRPAWTDGGMLRGRRIGARLPGEAGERRRQEQRLHCCARTARSG